MREKPYTLDRIFRIFVFVAVIFGLFLLLRVLRGVLLPFLIGWFLAYLINPLVEFFQVKMRLKKRVFAVCAALLTISAVIIFALWALIPALVNEFAKITEIFNKNIDFNNSFFPESWWNFVKSHLPKNTEENLLKFDNIEKIFSNVAPKFWGFFSQSLKTIFGIIFSFIILIYLIFILLDFEKISKGFISLIPEKYQKFSNQLLKDLKNGMNCYFRNQALIALIVGVLFAVGFSIIGLPMAVTMGIFIGFLNLVPYLQTIAILPIIGLLFIQSAETGESFWWLFFLTFLIFLTIQLFQDLILTPKIMGKAMGLNPAVILLSLSIWGTLLGFVGMIIALPATTLIISYYKRFVLKKLENSDEII